jgi:hypothetical protein
MKKKIALLMALVMVASMMPMNLFGWVSITPRVIRHITRTAEGSGAAAEDHITVGLRVQDIAGGFHEVNGQQTAQIRMILDGSWDMHNYATLSSRIWNYATGAANANPNGITRVTPNASRWASGETNPLVSGDSLQFRVIDLEVVRFDDFVGGQDGTTVNRVVEAVISLQFDPEFVPLDDPLATVPRTMGNATQLARPRTQWTPQAIPLGWLGELQLNIGMLVARDATATIQMDTINALGFPVNRLLGPVSVGGALQRGVTFECVGEATPSNGNFTLPPIRITERLLSSAPSRYFNPWETVVTDHVSIDLRVQDIAGEFVNIHGQPTATIRMVLDGTSYMSNYVMLSTILWNYDPSVINYNPNVITRVTPNASRWTDGGVDPLVSGGSLQFRIVGLEVVRVDDFYNANEAIIFLQFDPTFHAGKAWDDWNPVALPNGYLGELQLNIGMAVVGDATATLQMDTINTLGFPVRRLLGPVSVPIVGIPHPRSDVAVRLVAPLNYVWNTSANSPLNVTSRTIAFGLNQSMTATVVAQGFVGSRQWIDIEFSLPERNTSAAAQAVLASFVLEGLALIAQPGAASGNVNIDMAWAPVRTPWSGWDEWWNPAGNTATNTRAWREATLSAILAGNESWHNNWRILGLTVAYVPEPTATITVSTQTGNFPHQSNTNASFDFTTVGIPAGTYVASVGNLPTGVTIASSSVTVDANGRGRFQLTGSHSTVAGVYGNLTLTLSDSTGRIVATSGNFTLTISSPPGQGSVNQGAEQTTVQGNPATQPSASVSAYSTTVTVGEVPVSVRVSDNQAVISMTGNIRNQIADAADETVSFDLSDIDGLETAVIPQSDWAAFARAGLGLELVMPAGTLAFDEAAASSIGDAGGANIACHISAVNSSALTAQQQNSLGAGDLVFRVTVTANNRNVTNFNGALSVTVPYDGEQPVGVWRLAANGTMELLSATFDPEAGTVTFVTNRLSVFRIGLMEVAAPSAASSLRFTIGSASFISNGVSVLGDAAPFIDTATNRTMVPLRAIAEGLGAYVDWDNTTRTVHISRESVIASLAIDASLPNGMGTAVIVNNRTFVPVRYVSEILGADVRWDEVTRAVYIY